MSALGIYVLDFCLAFQSFPAPILWCQLLSSTGCIFVEIGSCRYNSQTHDWSGGGLLCRKYKSPKRSRENADSTPTLLAPTVACLLQILADCFTDSWLYFPAPHNQAFSETSQYHKARNGEQWQGAGKVFLYLLLLSTWLKVHLCQNPTDDHLPGLNCLSDEQLLPILLHMDPDTLLNIGR